MTTSPDHAVFTLDDLHRGSRAILATLPAGIVAYRLLREVLRVPPADPELTRSKKAALNSRWVYQLKHSQLPDGSWGRFHSQDTKLKTVFRTTEEAIDRAFALGLEPGDAPLARLHQYILGVLRGETHITDRTEKNEAWPLLVNFILAGRLVQLDPTNKILDPNWAYLLEVASLAFASGEYCLEDEAAAYLRLSGVHIPGGFLESQHALWILSSHRLPRQLDQALVNWIWHKPDGIRYLRVPLSNPPPRLIGYWLRSMSLLTRFDSWREISIKTLNQMWKLRDENGLWDFGSHIAKSVDFPLSESWRQANNRRLDYSTCLLVLLRRYFDDP